MPGRSFSSPSYRYGFNGQEKDDEVKGSGNSLDFGARVYDSRLGRFLSVDPLASDFAFMSTYCYAANSPIRLIDVFGMGPDDPQEGQSQDCGDGNSEISIEGQWRQDAVVTADRIVATITVTAQTQELKGWQKFSNWFRSADNQLKGKTTYTFGLVLRAAPGGGSDQVDLPTAKYTWTIDDFDVLMDILSGFQMQDRAQTFKNDVNIDGKPYIQRLTKAQFSAAMKGKIDAPNKRVYYNTLNQQYKLHKIDVRGANNAADSYNCKLVKTQTEFFNGLAKNIGENAFTYAANDLYNQSPNQPVIQVVKDKYDSVQSLKVDQQGTPYYDEVIYKNGDSVGGFTHVPPQKRKMKN